MNVDRAVIDKEVVDKRFIAPSDLGRHYSDFHFSPAKIENFQLKSACSDAVEQVDEADSWAILAGCEGYLSPLILIVRLLAFGLAKPIQK